MHILFLTYVFFFSNSLDSAAADWESPRLICCYITTTYSLNLTINNWINCTILCTCSYWYGVMPCNTRIQQAGSRKDEFNIMAATSWYSKVSISCNNFIFYDTTQFLLTYIYYIYVSHWNFSVRIPTIQKRTYMNPDYFYHVYIFV